MNYQLHHGDCLDILPTIPAQSVDAVICDPPYGTTACKWDSVIPFEPMWANIKCVLKPRGVCVLFGSQPFTSALVMSNLRWFKEELIWNKDTPSNFAAAKYVSLKYHEDIILFAKGRYTYNPQMREVGIVSNTAGRGRRALNGIHGKMGFAYPVDRNSTTRYPSTVLRFNGVRNNSNERVGHPTQKPLDLMEYLVKTYTNEGDTVLDFTFGSGTTGHACGNLGRSFIGIEKDAAYFALGSERIATAYEPLRAMVAV